MTYKCTFKPSQTNGHWHLTQQEATRCMKSWDKWNKPTQTERLANLSNQPHGTQADDK